MNADRLLDIATIIESRAVTPESAAEMIRDAVRTPDAPDPTPIPPRMRKRQVQAIRKRRQTLVAGWCCAAFGEAHAASIPQRGIRLAEEAIEAAQAAGCDIAMVHKLVDHIFAKPAGALNQELGGVGITLLALAEAAGISADEEESRELSRVLALPVSHFAARNKAKNDAGFNVSEVQSA